MVSGDRLERLIRRSDSALGRLEDSQLKAIDAALVQAERDLEQQVSRLYAQAQADVDGVTSAALREARARLLLGQVRSLIDLRAGSHTATLQTLISGASDHGAQAALELLSAYQADLVASTATLNIEAIAAASNASARLAQHGAVFASAVEREVIAGIVTGKGWAAVAREVRAAIGVTRGKAESLVRTESLNAFTTARQARFKESGVTHYTWISTADAGPRLCIYCASRAGATWEMGRGPLPPAHPRCRCTTVIDGPRFRNAGLIDLEFARKHSAETMKRGGFSQRTFGPTPFEKNTGQTFSKPWWTL